MSNSSRTLTLGALAMVAVTSCTLPPSQAWRQIQKDGLIPFVAQQWTEDGSGAPVTQTGPAQMVAQKQTPARITTPVTTPAPVVAGNTTPSPAMLESQKIPTASNVPGLSGYVRTPFTNPPRLVDVRGMSAGSKVVCPFTNKPFLVPASAQPAPQQSVASTPAPNPAPAAPQTPPPSSPAPTVAPTIPAPSTVAALTRPQPIAPTSPSMAPQTKPQPAPAPAVQPKPVAQEIPFGNAIAGRPGFVNSPFAAKHQLVDVTGLPTGMEVKCPYTGKLFRVPPQSQSQGSVPSTNVASPDKK